MKEGRVEERELKIGVRSGSYCFDVLCVLSVRVCYWWKVGRN